MVRVHLHLPFSPSRSKCYIFSPTKLSNFSTRNNTKTRQERCYFTNTDTMKKTDPYYKLGLSWGATSTEIKEAFRQKARELHPDVSKDKPSVALKKFQEIQEAYTKLMDVKGAPHREDLSDEWSFSVWRNGDLIAQDRTDVAGLSKKRPMKPATSTKDPNWGVAVLGHPGGGGSMTRVAEYLGNGGSSKVLKTSTVGTGHSKWMTPKEYVPWNPDTSRTDHKDCPKIKEPRRRDDGLIFSDKGWGEWSDT